MKPLMLRAFALVIVTCSAARADTLLERFPAPANTARADVVAGSFAAHLRTLPLMPPGTPVTSHAGDVVRAPWAEAVVDLDVGTRDLQQCADSAMRLYAEWRRTQKTAQTLVLHATSGDPIPYARYVRGERATAKGRGLSWSTGAAAGDTAAVWRAWLDTVFLYGGSISLAKDTVPATGPLRAGDLLVGGGSPGHVLVVLDVARPPTPASDDDAWLLLGQGFMPAQSFHVIGWKKADDDGVITVPSWPKPFPRESRRRFK